MATIKLGNRPKNFPLTITVPLHEGEEGVIKVSYIYRTRTEYGAFIDELMAEADMKLAGESEEEIRFSVEQAWTKTRDRNADYIMRIIDGWNLDQDFGRAAVVQLCDELPGAALAIMNRYTAAITEGRLKN
ncbi:phage tail assembly chaperone [Roseateles cavernae]|uniref:phage tail assembly chaperone n=1 Tax=Roseateles cavernae TaxID=3153578 RepID=UPI0032E4EADF